MSEVFLEGRLQAHRQRIRKRQGSGVRLSILASLDNFVSFLLGDSMARKPRLFAPGVLYHVIVRGNNRQKTFFNDGDYQAYIARLVRYRMQFGVTIYAYCLMSNHVHLLVETGSQPLSRFMQGGATIIYPVL